MVNAIFVIFCPAFFPLAVDLIPQPFKFCGIFLVEGRFLIRPFNVVFIHGGSFNLTDLLRSGTIDSNLLLIIVWNKDVFSLHEWAVLSKVGMSIISKYFLTAKRELGLKFLISMIT